MQIGLVDVDGHANKKKWGATIYPNIALGKIARWHRERGDAVEWAIGFKHYDTIYVSKVFSYTDDGGYIYDADNIIRGGTGYDLHQRAAYIQQQGIPQRLPVVHGVYGLGYYSEGVVSRYPHYGGVAHVRPLSEGAAYHIYKRIHDDEAQPDEYDCPEYGPDLLCGSLSAQIASLLTGHGLHMQLFQLTPAHASAYLLGRLYLW